MYTVNNKLQTKISYNLLEFLTIKPVLVNYDYGVFLFVYNANNEVQIKYLIQPTQIPYYWANSCELWL